MCTSEEEVHQVLVCLEHVVDLGAKGGTRCVFCNNKFPGYNAKNVSRCARIVSRSSFLMGKYSEAPNDGTIVPGPSAAVSRGVTCPQPAMSRLSRPASGLEDPLWSLK